MIRLYGIRNCDSCRTALKWLKANNVEFEFVNLRENGLSEDLLSNWQASLGWEMLLNKRSITWRNMPAEVRDGLDSASARRLILRYPTVLKRPVLDAGHVVLVGFDADSYDNLDL